MNEQIPVQLGGGIRDLDTIERYLDDGLSFIIIGTAAVKSPGFLKDACSAFGGHILVGLDAKGGKVATDGWSKLTGHEVVAPDLPGWGDSPLPTEAFSYVDFVAERLPGALVGNSFGGAVALRRLCRGHPQGIRACA